MLVRFISFIITVFGTKRYKPVLFAGLALVATLVGANTVLSLYRAQPHSAASTINQDQQEGAESQGLSKQGLQRQAPATGNQVPAAPTTPETPAATPTVPKADLAITTSALENTIIMKRDNTGIATSQAVTASISDNSKVQWLIIPQENTLGLSIIGATDRSSSSISFSLRGDSTLPAGQYSVTIHAKDSGRGIDLTKTIIVTITAE